MLASGLLFAVMGALIKNLSVSLPNEMVVFFRSFMGLLVLTPWLLHRGTRYFGTRRLGAHLLRALTGLAAMYCFFYALGRMPLAEAVLLNYSAPLFIPLAALLWMGEGFSRKLWWPIAIGFIGIVLILKPGAGLFTSAALIGLASGILSALAMAGIRHLTSTEPAVRIVFYFSLTATVVSAVPLLWAWQTPAPQLWLQLIAVGALASAAQILMTRAYAQAPAAQVGPFSYAIVVFAGVIGWAVWEELPDLLSLSGVVLVIAAGIVAIRLGGRKTAPATELPSEPMR